MLCISDFGKRVLVFTAKISKFIMFSAIWRYLLIHICQNLSQNFKYLKFHMSLTSKFCFWIFPPQIFHFLSIPELHFSYFTRKFPTFHNFRGKFLNSETMSFEQVPSLGLIRIGSVLISLERITWKNIMRIKHLIVPPLLLCLHTFIYKRMEVEKEREHNSAL